MNPNDVIIQPVISEKSTEMMEKNKYVFKVSLKANKQMIKTAIKDLFGVTPDKINVMNVRGKTKRLRYQFGNRPAWKKAIVTLKESDSFEIFEGQ